MALSLQRCELVASVCVQAAEEIPVDAAVAVRPEGDEISLRQAVVESAAAPAATVPTTIANEEVVPDMRRLSVEHNNLQGLMEDPKLRQLCGLEDLQPDLAAVLIRQVQGSLRTELSETVNIVSEGGQAREQWNRDGATTSMVHVRTVATQREPALLAVILNHKDVRDACVTDQDLLREVNESGNRELANMLSGSDGKRPTLALKHVKDVLSTDTVLPSLVVLTRKRDSRLKTRLVGCGNFDQSLAPDLTYSSTADTNHWRLFLVLAILLHWTVVGIDISEAFTQSDLKEPDASGKRTFVRLPSQWKSCLMPSMLRDLGVNEQNYNSYLLEDMDPICRDFHVMFFDGY